MNEEPNIKLPDPPTGTQWVYRGKAWCSYKPADYVYYLPREAYGTGETEYVSGAVSGGFPDVHYWEAVAADDALRNENAQLRAMLTDHHEVKKALERNYAACIDARDAHMRRICELENERDAVYEELEATKRPVEQKPDFAQQAKDELQRIMDFHSFHTGFRDLALDNFVDLILKAAKQ